MRLAIERRRTEIDEQERFLARTLKQLFRFKNQGKQDAALFSNGIVLQHKTALYLHPGVATYKWLTKWRRISCTILDPVGLRIGILSRNDNLVWMDMEMSGLDPDVDRILEIATIVTDSDLDIIAEGPVVVIFQEDEILDAMDEWNADNHERTGLIDRVRKEGVSVAEAESTTIEFLSKHVEDGQSPLCGNTIGQDRRFLVKFMPNLEQFLHYRSVDVSTVKELARRWRPDIHDGFQKKAVHMAMEDIKESIEELRRYRDQFFRMN